jgi:hypothetical protein
MEAVMMVTSTFCYCCGIDCSIVALLLLLLLLPAFDDSNAAGLDDGAAALLLLPTTTKMTAHQVSVPTLHLNPSPVLFSIVDNIDN